MDGVRVWLSHACSWARAIRREYATTLGELLRRRSGLGGDVLINYLKGGEMQREAIHDAYPPLDIATSTQDHRLSFQQLAA